MAEANRTTLTPDTPVQYLKGVGAEAGPAL